MLSHTCSSSVSQSLRAALVFATTGNAACARRLRQASQAERSAAPAHRPRTRSAGRMASSSANTARAVRHTSAARRNARHSSARQNCAGQSVSTGERSECGAERAHGRAERMRAEREHGRTERMRRTRARHAHRLRRHQQKLDLIGERQHRVELALLLARHELGGLQRNTHQLVERAERAAQVAVRIADIGLYAAEHVGGVDHVHVLAAAATGSEKMIA